MAHHNHTPQSVLNAPKATITYLSEQPYKNRFMRRHFQEKKDGVLGKLRTIPKPFREQAFNEPYRKPAAVVYATYTKLAEHSHLSHFRKRTS